METYKDINGYIGFYQISNLGNIKSLERRIIYRNKPKTIQSRIMKLTDKGNGYLVVTLSKNSKQKTHYVHQLMAIAFLNHKPCGHKLVVNHINFNKKDNRLDNLEVVTHRENGNMKHLKSTSKYTGVSWYKPTNKWVSIIYIENKNKYLGYFDNEYNAHLAYQNALNKIL